MIVDINVKAKTTKFLKINTGINIPALGLGKAFLDITAKVQMLKGIIGKIIKIKNVLKRTLSRK